MRAVNGLARLLTMNLAISPGVKKVLSGIAVGAASAVLVEVVHDLPQLVAFVPVYARALAVAVAAGVVTGAAHVLDAWGHTDRVTAAVEAAKPAPAGTP